MASPSAEPAESLESSSSLVASLGQVDMEGPNVTGLTSAGVGVGPFCPRSVRASGQDVAGIFLFCVYCGSATLGLPDSYNWVTS